MRMIHELYDSVWCLIPDFKGLFEAGKERWAAI